jgi:ubiquinone/menaquinone biosynthesis C-methylase UbiE
MRRRRLLARRLQQGQKEGDLSSQMEATLRGRSVAARPSAEEQEARKRCARECRLGLTDTVLDIERAVCGCDYGGTSWTTRAEADDIGTRLRLAPGKRLLDLGAGSGWPGLYLARRSGCDVTLADLPVDGLRAARRRAARDGLTGACWLAAADGASLPFADRSFDAIQHADVLCCLTAKREVLAECRRVIRGGAPMIFTVISVTPGLGREERERALAAGPPFKAESRLYPELLAETGWRLGDTIELTAQYARSLRRMIEEEDARERALVDILGEAEVADKRARRQRTLAALQDGLLRRDLYCSTAGPMK